MMVRVLQTDAAAGVFAWKPDGTPRFEPPR